MNADSATDHSTLDTACAALAAGGIVVLRDAAHPESGAYLCASARKTSPDVVNFMASHGGGLVCLALLEEQIRRLGIPMLVAESTLGRRMSFGASIEASRGVTTGISAADRSCTILAASDPTGGPGDIVMPGHVFPVLARDGGVLVRDGIAEAAVDLCVLAGERPAATLCALLDEQGELASDRGVDDVCARLDLPVVSVEELVAHRLGRELVVERIAEREFDSGFGGRFRAVAYRNDFDQHEHMALVAGDISGPEPVPVRVHSQCVTGDVFGSLRCDCGEQLELAIERINAEGRGVIVYMHQEGRGIGLANKIRAYALQDQGRDTVEANLELGFKEDLRDYGFSAQILRDLGIGNVALLTNNPQKLEGLRRYGIQVVERRAIETPANAANIGYLRAKRSKLGHMLAGFEPDGEPGDPDHE
jgi:3,4-dihydroxy 2-butanone 4-phosphate synthase/GTP cyclohydrolase II